ncbi:MAG: VCBS repeat-containing protein [Phycisphaerae bacterium]
MVKHVLFVIGLGICVSAVLAGTPAPQFKRLQLTDRFYCEGAFCADFNRDGKMDVVSGPFWYEGPDFRKTHEIRAPKAFDPKDYSDNFLTYTGDFNGDGWPDVLYLPHPGKEGYWFENPAGKEGPWKQHLALQVVDNESPRMADVDGDGRPDLVCNTGGSLGYATYDPAKPDQPWTFHPISPKGKYHKYTHGIGLGDINGDGRADFLEAEGWWEQPAAPQPGQPWIKHPFKFADAACQMHAYDVDGDGLNDVVTVWHCHKYGLVWYKQVRGDDGRITWKQNVILPPEPDLKSDALRISQLHAMEVVDVNGDGLKDILVGKRFWSHGPTGDVEPDAPAVIYWFELRRDKEGGVQFLPHLIDDNSGVGTQVAAEDLNGDGIPDVIVGNKKGTFVHLSQSAK